jgi:fructan beta-fructosidase
MHRPIGLLCTLSLLVGAAVMGAARDDILVSDFEGAAYGDWKAAGEAFGPGPARGTLAGQMEVSGFLGKGLVNSFFKGDGTTGTLTSPPFKIQRQYITFLIGGGMNPADLCINLLVGGKAVRTATGPNDKPGGSEKLNWHSWDVRELEGREAVIEIVDRATGGWGHISIDQIAQSDRRAGAVESVKKLALVRDYLAFCFPAGQEGRAQIALFVDGKVVRRSVASARDKSAWISWDVSRLKGRSGEVRVTELPGADGGCPLAESVALTDEVKGALIVVDKPYQETYRPQFHFSPRTNWTNDPNGLVFYKGEYHIFFQHNPFGIDWGNMTWGHAVSPDLVHWTQLEHALHPDKLGTMFSGSAVVDSDDTAGFRKGEEQTLVAIYTAAGGSSPESQGQPFTQCIAYSNDRGRTWTKYDKNPVLAHVAGSNRDPKVIWHAPTKKWVMALYLDGSDYALFGSPNLKEWTKLCDVPMPGTSECPDFFPLAVDGDTGKALWVFWGANGNYRLGAFDGARFLPDTPVLQSRYGANDYAAQTYSDIPAADGRRIQITWMQGGQYPSMPFNQQMGFPRVMTLRSTSEGVRMFFAPVKEIESLHAAASTWNALAIESGRNALAELEGELWDIAATIEPGKSAELGFTVRGAPLAYDVGTQTLRTPGGTAPVKLENGKVDLRILVDRSSIEVFAAGGRYLICFCFLPDPADRSLALYAKGAGARATLAIHALESAWKSAK